MCAKFKLKVRYPTLHLMNVKYDIIHVRMLIKFNEQWNSVPGKNHLEI